MSEIEEATQAQIREIAFEELEIQLSSGSCILVDVRNPDELLTQGSIPKAINIPLPEVPDAFKNLSEEEFKSKYGFEKHNSELIFSCRSGKRAEAAIENLNGVISYEKIRLYRGSFTDWEAKGGPINK